MIHIDIDESFLEEVEDKAREEAREMGNLNGSIEDGDGNFAGLLAEYLFVDYFGGERDPTFDYDVVWDGKKIDVKTKRRSVKPEPYYECSIADFNTEQDCDWYYFVSILYDKSEAWLLGYKSPEDYYEKAEFHEEGDYDPDNGFTFKADCWNLPISELDQVDTHKP